MISQRFSGNGFAIVGRYLCRQMAHKLEEKRAWHKPLITDKTGIGLFATSLQIHSDDFLGTNYTIYITNTMHSICELQNHLQ